MIGNMNALLQEKLTEIILFVAILVGFHQAIAWNGPHRGVIMPVMMIDAPLIVCLTGIFILLKKRT